MKSSISPNRFYVYALFRPGCVDPFYIGKGKDRRIDNHFDCARKKENCKHQVCRIIRKEWREGGEITKVKIAEDIPEQAAFDLEKLFISLGTIYNWPLVNKTIGGEGTSGFRRTMSPEEREQHRQRSIERFAKPEEHEKLRLGALQRFSDPKEREKQRQRVLKHFSDPEERAKHSQRGLQRYANAAPMSDEEREERRQRALKQWSDSDFREQRSLQELQRYANPEVREKHRQISKALWEDPEYREKILQKNSDPETKARKSKAASERGPNHFGAFDGFISPSGQIFAPVVNLQAFCREHGLSYCGMWLVDQGKQSHHRGWTRYHPGDPAQPTLF